MGNLLCGCVGKKSSDKKNGKQKEPIAPEPEKTEPSNISASESTTSIHSSQEILDDDFTGQITQAIDEHMASIPFDYQAERDRIVEAMKVTAPEAYLGLLFSDYPDKNQLTVNEIARRVVTSNEVKKKLIDQIDERIESSFQLRTVDWSPSSRETMRPVIKTYIEKLVNEAFDQVELT